MKTFVRLEEKWKRETGRKTPKWTLKQSQAQRQCLGAASFCLLEWSLSVAKAGHCLLDALLICPKIQHILRNTTTRFIVDLLSLFFLCNWNFVFFAQYFPISVFSPLPLMDAILNFSVFNCFSFSEAMPCLSSCS